MMKNVLVTGANGFIGSTLVNNLLKNGEKVVAIDISFAAPRIPDCDQVVKLEVGLDDVEKLKNLIHAGEYDAMYHLAWAGVNGPSKADPTVQLNNIQLGINCAQLCKAIGVKKLLCAGTVAEQAVHSLPNLSQTSGGMMYGVAKHCTHLMLENYSKNIGQPFVWMQLSNIYGPGNMTGNLVSYTLSELFAGNDPCFGPANQPYDFVSVEDTIEAIKRLGDRNTIKNSYYIGSGQPRLLKDYLLMIGKAMGCPERIGIGKRPDDGIRYTMEMFDANDLKTDIGEYITKTFEDGILETIDWMKTKL
jgi:nucleoside-diphosphate-sugar epimerase